MYRRPFILGLLVLCSSIATAETPPAAIPAPEAPPAAAITAEPSPVVATTPETPPAAAPDPARAQMITLTTAIGTTLDAYVAGPEDATKGILILHDRWGLDKTQRQWVDRYAARGYRALAIDVFDGRAASKYDLATEIMNAADPEAVKVDIRAGLKYLRAPGRKLATLGAGYGGWQSFQAALMSPGAVAATVVLYAPLDATAEQISAFKAPILAIFARNDAALPSAQVTDYERRFKKALVRYSGHVVNADHGFIDPQYATAYDEKLAQEAWREIDDFLADFVE